MSLPNARAGKLYSQQINHLRGTGPFTYTIISGSPPFDITLSTSGLLAGDTLTTFLTFFTVQVMDSSGDTATQALSIAVNIPNCVNCHTAAAH
jgi:hypothetical protein